MDFKSLKLFTIITTTCGYTIKSPCNCNAVVDFTHVIVKDVLISGLADEEIKKEVIGWSEIDDKTAEELDASLKPKRWLEMPLLVKFIQQVYRHTGNNQSQQLRRLSRFHVKNINNSDFESLETSSVDFEHLICEYILDEETSKMCNPDRSSNGGQSSQSGHNPHNLGSYSF